MPTNCPGCGRRVSRSHHGGDMVGQVAASGTFNLDPKNLLPPDVYAATQSDQGKALGKAMGNIAGAVLSGNQTAMWSAAEAATVGLATAANPLAGIVVGAVLSLIDALPHAKGSDAPPNLICPQGEDQKGIPPLSEMQGWTDPVEPNYIGLPKNVGSYMPWLQNYVQSAGNDPFLRVMAGYIGYNRGKVQNCYFDVPREQEAMIIALAMWNAKGGNFKTVTRTIRGVDSNHPTTFGNQTTPGEAPIPADWDSVDIASATPEGNENVNAWGYAQLAYAMWATQNPNASLPDVAKGQNIVISMQVRVPDADDYTAQGLAPHTVKLHLPPLVTKPISLSSALKNNGYAILAVQPSGKTSVTSTAPATTSTVSKYVWPAVPALGGIGAAIFFANPLIALAGLGLGLGIYAWQSK